MKMIQKVIKKYSLVLLLSIFTLGVSLTTTSCTKKVGCAINDNAGPATYKDGTLKMKKGKSSLFGNKKRKKTRN